MRRPAAVSGLFYPDNPDELRAYLSSVLDLHREKREIKAALAPHAGYIYSGKTAAACYSMFKQSDCYIILAPNHTGLGSPFSIMTGGTYTTPLGDVEIDEELSLKILKNSTILEEDPIAQIKEHAIEVQLPFLQFLSEKAGRSFKIVPIVLATQQFDDLEEIGVAIASAIDKRSAVIIASSDMNHYESQEITQKKDSLAIEQMLMYSPFGLLETVQKNSITMCGVGPAVSAMIAAKHLGASKAELIAHSTSAEINHDYHNIVGYSSIIFY